MSAKIRYDLSAAAIRHGSCALTNRIASLTLMRIRMRETFLMAFAVAIIMSGGIFGNRAEAMRLDTPSTLGAVAARAALVKQAVNVCGNSGCVPVQTKRVQHHRPGGLPAKHIGVH
jgi:hypothetical protein